MCTHNIVLYSNYQVLSSFYNETVTLMKLWLKWNCDSNETVTQMKLWLKWNCDSNETVTQMKLWLKWNCDSNETVTQMKLCLKWNCDPNETVTQMKLWLKFVNNETLPYSNVVCLLKHHFYTTIAVCAFWLSLEWNCFIISLCETFCASYFSQRLHPK